MTALVVPLWNQWDCTRAFLESLESAEPAGSYELILIDNGSSDATARELKAWSRRIRFRLIRNRKNLGCAPAWNQGVRAALKNRAVRWIGVLNNDLVLSPGTIGRCLRRAGEKGWDLVSPATREGALDYALEDYAAAYTRRLFRRDDEGNWFGWCFFVRAEVFRRLGLFDEGFKLGIGEDEDFARRMAAAGYKTGVTGSAFVHHFGSRSLDELRKERGRGFEERNLKLLRGRWGSPSRRGVLAKSATVVSRLWQRLRWGHLLKE